MVGGTHSSYVVERIQGVIKTILRLSLACSGTSDFFFF